MPFFENGNIQTDLQTDKEESTMSQLFGMDNVFSPLKGNYDNKVKNETTKVKNTIGNPSLSKDAASYYEELKAKHSDVEFVLVSEDQKETAKEQAANINSNKSMIVLISEDEVEQMATDENVRTQNEKLIADAKAQMPDLMKQLKESGTEVKSFGMEFDDKGNASYFAVVDKSMAAQKELIENKQAEKRAEKKADAKEANAEKLHSNHKEDLTTVTASSVEELIDKIKDVMYEAKADNIMTTQEKMVGQSFDFSI